MVGDVCAFQWRYGSEEMRRLLSRENIVRRMAEVEAALMYGLEEAGLAPAGSGAAVEEAARKVTADEVYALESKTGHEVFSLALLLSEKAGELGSHVHLGATSNDIVDTAWALIFKDALDVMEEKLQMILRMLREYAVKYRDLVMAGRTHGQHALPVTLGFKFANYLYEISRSLERMRECRRRLVRGKIAGAVGTMAAWGSSGLKVEGATLRRLGLEPHPITTQVAPRDGHAELGAVLAILASQLERLALEVRELSRPEIGELYEGHGERVGSSTMPHKRNPVISERICGLAKLVRSLSHSLLENIALWHERDLTNSSLERVVLPHLLLAVDEILDSTIKLLEILRVDEENIKRNLRLLRGAAMSESVMVKLVMRGMPRHEAYRRVRDAVERMFREGKSMEDSLLEDPEVSRLLSRREISEALDPRSYLGQHRELIDRAIRYAETVAGGL